MERIAIVWIIRTANLQNISHEDLDMAKIRKALRKSESLRLEAQKNAIS